MLNLIRPLFGGAPLIQPMLTDTGILYASTASPSFAGLSFGPAAANRTLVALVGTGLSGRSITDMTMGGVAAAHQVSKVHTNVNNSVEIWSALVPAGETGTVAWTLSGTNALHYLGILALYGANPSAVDTATSQADPLAAALNVPAGGIGVAVAYTGHDGPFTWLGLDEAYELNESAGSPRSGGAFNVFSAEQTGLAIEADTTDWSDAVLCAAAFAHA